jgi:hypothetical protein
MILKAYVNIIFPSTPSSSSWSFRDELLNLPRGEMCILSISRNVTPTIGKLLAAVSYATRNEGH